ncbi:MAG: efflux RND transporter periplasmic adaptor subunit [Acidobacteria bacterium]|nr:efflux RND transporter periplasmic adaptor subunit [Acidobacteriota bacterium]MDW7983579.1 efflux RND transporter periplasmic adaptor subunit [Acidobacteriota bacterium]
MGRGRRRVLQWAVVGVVLLGFIGLWQGARSRGRAITVEVAPSTVQDLRQVVAASGKIRPWTEVSVSSQINGRVWRVAVQEGDRVQKGQVLVEIDPVPLRTQLDRLQAALQAARQQVESARLTLEQVRRNWDRARELFGQGLLTKEALEKSQTEWEIRQREYAVAQERLRELEAQLESLRHDYEQVRVTSPIDGWVIGVYVEEGETVFVSIAGIGGERPLVKVADLTRWKVRLEVDENDIVQVREGQSVRLTIDALPDREFWGRVTLVGYQPLSETTSQQLGQTVRENLFPVEVELRETLPEVRPGFTVHAEIVTAEKKQVLSIPIQALVHRVPGGDKPEARWAADVAGVFVWEGGRVHFRPIQVGIMGEFDLEVRSGLQPGEQIVVGPYEVLRALKDGDRVRVQSTRR